MRLFHGNMTLEVDLDDDGNTIIISTTTTSIKYNMIGVTQHLASKVTRELAPVLSLCFIQAA